MATRGAITRLVSSNPIRFSGVYHHWDSYPESLGKTLWELYHAVFGKDMDALLKMVVDEHPAGWSSLHTSTFASIQSIGAEPNDTELRMRNDLARLTGAAELSSDLNCYCHGERSEEGWEVNERNAAGSGIEYCYAFGDGDKSILEPAGRNTMFVLSSYRLNGDKMIGMFGFGDGKAKWRVIAEVDLNGDEPNWEHIATRTYAQPLQ